jgi:hypothetical protein
VTILGLLFANAQSQSSSADESGRNLDARTRFYGVLLMFAYCFLAVAGSVLPELVKHNSVKAAERQNA